MGAEASSELPFNQWSAQDVGIAASRLIDPQNPHPCINFFISNNLSGANITAMPNLTEVSNLLYRFGNANIFHHRILRLFLTKVPGGLPCEHPFMEVVALKTDQDHISEHFICLDCKNRVTDPAKIQRELAKREFCRQQNSLRRIMRSLHSNMSSPSPPIGVSISWLVNFTQEHNCWHLPTWLVRRLYVLPLTSQTHCCYADLPHMQQEEANITDQQQNLSERIHASAGGNESVTGPAHTFICHKWGDLWGDLVRAVTQHSSDWNIKVYIDVFCCNPYEFPSTNTTLNTPPSTPQREDPNVGTSSTDPLIVMRQCQAFLLVSPSLEHMSQNLTANEADKLSSPQFWNSRMSESSL